VIATLAPVLPFWRYVVEEKLIDCKPNHSIYLRTLGQYLHWLRWIFPPFLFWDKECYQRVSIQTHCKTFWHQYIFRSSSDYLSIQRDTWRNFTPSPCSGNPAMFSSWRSSTSLAH
jgi:hypothetical protein